MKLDYLNGTNYSIHQPDDLYHFNSDTELLGRFMDVHKNDSVLDIGTNNGALLYYAHTKHATKLCGIDLFDKVIQNAKQNFERNGLQVSLYVVALQHFEHEPFDLIICNPPYFHTQVEHLKNQNEILRAARHEEYLHLDDLFSSVRSLLKDNGRFAMVYRPDQMTILLQTASKYGLYAKRMKIAYATYQKQAKSLLVEFVKSSKTHLCIEAPAFLNDRDSFGWKGEK